MNETAINKKKLPHVSVVVPVYNGTRYIRGILGSLLEQDYPLDRFEVLIVNNASTDNTQEIVEECIPRFKGSLRCIYEGKKGKSQARNRGIEESRGEIICFTDDDCVASPQWLSSIVRVFEESKADAVLGKIVLATKIPPEVWYPKWFLEERFAHVDYGDKVVELKDEPLVGANMSCRKELFKKYGGFNPNPVFNLCQDSELSMRLTKGGVKKIYCPEAVIYHHYDISRISDQKFYRQSFSWGRVSVYLDPVDMSGFKYFLFRLKKIIVQAVQLPVLYMNRDREKLFLLKCKISTNWGRCFELIRNGFRYAIK